MGRARLAVALALGVVVLLAGCTNEGAGGVVAAHDTGAASDPVAVKTAALSGIYRWANTLAQTKGTAAEGAESVVPADDLLIVAPNTFTMTLEDGTWSMITTATPRQDGGTYSADGAILEMEWTIPATEGPFHMEYAYTVADDGSLSLVPQPGTDPVDAFVYSTNPWTKIG